MPPAPLFRDNRQSNPSAQSGGLTSLVQHASDIGFGIVDVAALLDQIEGTAKAQVSTMESVQTLAERIVTANSSVRSAITSVSDACADAEAQVETSVSDVKNASDRTRNIAAWVEGVGGRMEAIGETLESVESENGNIAAIAQQVNILAINAKIEAARAGDFGRGFSVVADAINDLSQQTSQAAESITSSVRTLAEMISAMRAEATGISHDAGSVLEDSARTDAALTAISAGVRLSARNAENVTAEAETVREAIAGFAPAIHQVVSAARDTTRGITDSRSRVHGLVDRSEVIVQESVELGGETGDAAFIAHCRAAADEIGHQFDKTLADGRIAERDLFSEHYTPVTGTDPQQVLAPFTMLTDRILPPILEAALELDPRVVFCAAVDRNGYLPTHNRKFSQPQGADPVWNAAHCRNRRIFDDRVGLKAGQSTSPFLVQIYRRDMGGGEFVMMKDVSAPIWAADRHWGGLRLAYQL
ncbi:methyl-accepting chemotaxis protein [Tropicimonas marinistellae]|uniref:methyl-accepting chemotaxis protein n=1 Tax=Tropicimonas marinistellae TaxID=1739787 RepID=UPI000AF030B4|nr:methyl-accepting chemotaxis protein [Tropicimonas marinistellae]